MSIPEKRKLSSDDVFQGTVLSLPSQKEVCTVQKHRAAQKHRGQGMTGVRQCGSKYETLDTSGYNHPVLVVSRPAATDQRVNFLIMTTSKFSYGEPADIVPISNSIKHCFLRDRDRTRNVHAELYKELKLADDRKMSKRGHVSIRQVYELDWQDLQPFTLKAQSEWCRLQLDRESLARLLQLLEVRRKYAPGVQLRIAANMSAEELAADEAEKKAERLRRWVRGFHWQESQWLDELVSGKVSLDLCLSALGQEMYGSTRSKERLIGRIAYFEQKKSGPRLCFQGWLVTLEREMDVMEEMRVELEYHRHYAQTEVGDKSMRLLEALRAQLMEMIAEHKAKPAIV